MQETLRDILRTDSAVLALVGDRIDWLVSPQGGAMPRIVLRVIDDAEGLTYGATDGLSAGRVQVDCYAATYSAAVALARAVRARLASYSGRGFKGVFHDGWRDGREDGQDEAERPFFVSLDFRTMWSTDP